MITLDDILSSAPHNGRTQDGLQTPVPLAVGDEAIFPLLGIGCFKIVVPTYYLVTLYSYCPPSIGRLVLQRDFGELTLRIADENLSDERNRRSKNLKNYSS